MAANAQPDSDVVCIIEKDTNGDILTAWSYPSLEDESEAVLLARSNLAENTIPLQFTYSKYKHMWMYIYTHVVEKDSNSAAAMKRVSVFSLCLIKNTFNPEKYAALCKLMASIYNASGEPPKILQCHLSLMTRGSYDAGNELGKFVDAEYDNRRAYLVSSIRDLIRLFGDDIIFLWMAMIAKKRVVVYSDNLSALLKVIRGLPVLVWHRQNWNILRPYVTLKKNEISDLTSAGVFVAGFTDSGIRAQEQIYDLYVDINARSVHVPHHAKDAFGLGNFHHDLKAFLTAAAEASDATDQTIIKNLSMKTKDILTKLESLKVDGYITLEGLQQRRLPPGMDRFLYAVASAESMTK